MGEWAAVSPFAWDREQDTGWTDTLSELGVPASLQQPGASGSVGLGLLAPSLPPQPSLAQRGHRRVSDRSPPGTQEGVKCLCRSRCPGAERVAGDGRLQPAGGRSGSG